MLTSQSFSANKLSQKGSPRFAVEAGLAHIFLVIILLLGIISGVYLVQKTQIFKPKASEGDNVIHITNCQDINKPGKYVVDNDFSGDEGKECIRVRDTHDIDLNCGNHMVTSAQNTSNPLIYLNNVYNFNIESCRFSRKSSKNGEDIVILNGRSGSITSNTINDGNLVIEESRNIQVKNNTFNSASILLVSVEFSVVDNNKFRLLDSDLQSPMALTRLLGAVFVFSQKGYLNRIINNVFDGGSDGSYANNLGADDAIVLGNEMDMRVGEKFTTVDNNTISNVFDCGIETVGLVSGLMISNNKIDNAGYCGVGGWWSSSLTKNFVFNNEVNDSASLFRYRWKYRQSSDLLPNILKFEGNSFIKNKYVNPKKYEAEPGNKYFIRSVSIDPDNDKVVWERSHNEFGRNEIGSIAPPYFIPGKPSIRDRGGNVCVQGTEDDFPLDCINPNVNNLSQSQLIGSQNVMITHEQLLKDLTSETKNLDEQAQLDDIQKRYDTQDLQPISHTEVKKPAVSCNGFDGYGDLNGDGFVSEEDLYLAQQMIVGLVIPSADQQKRSRVGLINSVAEMEISDLEDIKNYLGGSISTFPVCSS